MPEQRDSKPDIVVDALGPLPAPQPNGQPGWKLEAKQRLLIVDLPAAPDQDDHAQGPAPMGVADDAGMQNDRIVLCIHDGIVVCDEDRTSVVRLESRNVTSSRKQVVVIFQAARKLATRWPETF